MKVILGRLLSVMAALICLWGMPAGADETPSPEDRVSIETVTVTAAKRETLARDFPGSISVKDGFFLQDHQVRTTDAVARFIPNLFYKKATSGDAFISRGISTIDTSLYSPMGLYVNDVAYPLSYMQAGFLLDTERIEVLRGPQSTLYGKNSSSGVVNVVLAEPDNEFRGQTFLEASSYKTWTGGWAASGAAVENRLFWGISATGMDTEGYMENPVTGETDVGDDQRISARGTLRWTPNDQLAVSLFLDGQDRDYGISALRFEDGPFATDRFQVISNGPDRAEQDSLGQVLRINWEGRETKVTAITSHQRFNRTAVMDFDRSPVALGHSDINLSQETWSQEIRVSGNAGASMGWLAGLYASHEALDNTWALNHVNPAMANRRVSDTTIQSAALFGQSTLSLTPKLKATAGLRLDCYEGSGSQAYTRAGTISNYDRDLSEVRWLPMASLSYAFTNRISGYLTYATGWMAGGYDYYSATSEETFTYDPEYTENYEIGIKSHFFKNRLKLDLAAFYTDIEDKQVREEIPGGGAGMWTYTNAARAHTRGVELEITALPTANLELYGGVGYARAEVDDWIGTSGGLPMDYSGKRLPWAPELTANAGIGYFANNGLYGTADLFWSGRQYFDAANTLEDSGHALVNLKAGYRHGAMDISIWCHNLLDREYADKKVKDNLGRTLIEDGAPRTLGITLNWRF